jgi:hypothetical protein
MSLKKAVLPDPLLKKAFMMIIYVYIEMKWVEIKILADSEP